MQMHERKGFSVNVKKVLFFGGLLIVQITAALLLLGDIESIVAAAIGNLGIGLIAVSGRSNMKRAP
jgi:hypothetical protein